MTTSSLPTRVSRGRRFVLRDVNWDFYESMLRGLGDRHIFLTYYKGTLELMSPSYPHDRSSLLLLYLMQALAEAFDVPLHGVGSTTFRRKRYKVGLEADEAFYTYNAARILGKDVINLDMDPPPDLAIEVEVSRRLGARAKVYARLGVPEIWKYDRVQLKMLVLQKNGQYKVVDRSPTFPHVTPHELADWLRTGLDRYDGEWLKEVRSWLQERVMQIARK
jgi:Uma2 family endonuclease